MALGGIISKRVKLAYSVTSPLSWQEITEQVLNIDTDFSQVGTDIDTTTYGPLFLRSKISGLPEAPEVVFTMLADPDPATSPEQEHFRDMQASQAAFWFRREQPCDTAGTSYRGETYQVTCKSIENTSPVDGRMEMKVTLAYYGNYAIDAAAGASQI